MREHKVVLTQAALLQREERAVIVAAAVLHTETRALERSLATETEK